MSSFFFVGPYTKYRSDLVVNLQYVCCLSVVCPWKFQELWLVDTVHAGYPTRALIGQHKLGDTKPVLWQCGLVHLYTNWYRGWIYCTTVKRFQAQCVHHEYHVAVQILKGTQGLFNFKGILFSDIFWYDQRWGSISAVFPQLVFKARWLGQDDAVP
jgi:hypothetical protein